MEREGGWAGGTGQVPAHCWSRIPPIPGVTALYPLAGGLRGLGFGLGAGVGELSGPGLPDPGQCAGDLWLLKARTAPLPSARGVSCRSVGRMGFPTAPAPCRSAGSQEETRCWEEATCPRDGLEPWFRQQLSSWLTVPPGVRCVSAVPKQRLAAPGPGNRPVSISCVHPLTCPGCLRCYPRPPQQQKGSSQPSGF